MFSLNNDKTKEIDQRWRTGLNHLLLPSMFGKINNVFKQLASIDTVYQTVSVQITTIMFANVWDKQIVPIHQLHQNTYVSNCEVNLTKAELNLGHRAARGGQMGGGRGHRYTMHTTLTPMWPNYSLLFKLSSPNQVWRSLKSY